MSISSHFCPICYALQPFIPIRSAPV